MQADRPLMTGDECRRAYEMVERTARTMGVRNVEVLVAGTRSALTRFANNAIHQNVVEHTRGVSVRILVDHRTARVTTNRIDEESIRRTVEEAFALTKSAAPDPELLPLHSPESFSDVERFDPGTASATPEERARSAAEAIRIIESADQTAAGIYSTEDAVLGVFNSRGVAANHCETMARFSITAMGADSSGWSKASAVRLSDLDPAGLARTACEKARCSGSPREVEPGHYTVVLEPAAVLDLVGQIFGDFSGTAIEDQRSFLVERLGESLFGSNINIFDDVFHPLQAGAPFDAEGVPRKRLKLVDAGVPREVAYSRSSAAKAGATPTGHGLPVPNEIGELPLNIVMEGGSTPVEEMIAGTDRGILVTRLWYIREVDPYEKIMTGMTRDGTFLIEGGRIVSGVRNFRFNQSVIELLNNVEALSPALRSSGEESFDMVVPALKVNDFHFTDVTRF